MANELIVATLFAGVGVMYDCYTSYRVKPNRIFKHRSSRGTRVVVTSVARGVVTYKYTMMGYNNDPAVLPERDSDMALLSFKLTFAPE